MFCSQHLAQHLGCWLGENTSQIQHKEVSLTHIYLFQAVVKVAMLAAGTDKSRDLVAFVNVDAGKGPWSSRVVASPPPFPRGGVLGGGPLPSSEARTGTSNRKVSVGGGAAAGSMHGPAHARGNGVHGRTRNVLPTSFTVTAVAPGLPTATLVVPLSVDPIDSPLNTAAANVRSADIGE